MCYSDLAELLTVKPVEILPVPCLHEFNFVQLFIERDEKLRTVGEVFHIYMDA